MPRRLEKLKFAAMLRAAGIYRHITLGARTVVLAENRLLLVRHGYVKGWQFPGGGVDPGETIEEAARREVREETGFAVSGPMQLFGLYHSTLYTNRDHVALFIARDAAEERRFVPNREIAEIGWFDLDALPQDFSPAARRRLAEIAGDAPQSPVW